MWLAYPCRHEDSTPDRPPPDYTRVCISACPKGTCQCALIRQWVAILGRFAGGSGDGDAEEKKKARRWLHSGGGISTLQSRLLLVILLFRAGRLPYKGYRVLRAAAKWRVIMRGTLPIGDSNAGSLPTQLPLQMS